MSSPSELAGKNATTARASRDESEVMAESMDRASSYSERASSPTVGSEKILGNLREKWENQLVFRVEITGIIDHLEFGYLPLSCQTSKKGFQSM